MKQLILTIGISGSGKSTLLKQRFHPSIIVNPDSIRKEFTGNVSDHSQEPRVWSEVRKRVNQLLEKNDIAVLDATNVDSKMRGQFLKNYPGVEKIALIFKTNPEVAKQRISADLSNKIDRSVVPPEIVDKQYKKLMAGYNNIPQQFDKIEYVNESKQKSAIDKKQLKIGIAVEMEHTNDRKKAAKIAIEHLRNNPEYYTKLHKAGLIDEPDALKLISLREYIKKEIKLQFIDKI